MVITAYRRVLLLEQAPVADGLCLGMRKGDMPALAFVAIEDILVCFSMPDRDKLVRQIEGVMDAAVHPHGPDGTVHMGGVARQDHSPDPKFFRHALVDHVKIACDDVERSAGRQKSLQSCL